MSVKSRIKEFVKSNKITIRDFERSIGASNGYVNSIKKSLGQDKIESIIESYPKINIDWLISGRGSMYKTEPSLIESESIECPPSNIEDEAEYWKNQYIEVQRKYTALLENKLKLFIDNAADS